MGKKIYHLLRLTKVKDLYAGMITRVVLKSHCAVLWSTEVHHAIYRFVFYLFLLNCKTYFNFW